MEYGSTMWSPHTAKNINLLESIQRRATRWIKSKHDSTLHQYWWLLKGIEVVYTGTLTALIYHSVYIVMLYSIMNNQTPINFCHSSILIQMLHDPIHLLYKLNPL